MPQRFINADGTLRCVYCEHDLPTE
ncbi:MAG: hypothetical protein NC402_00215 [Prevotella sp.]|nr:hypothetical protein [Prevotella sp.]